ncbi:hypothetical protein [Bacillus luti]|uniref:hypothetical protein n=1 Tax=Bacillus luti TaxID=2026191 RepID=UPI00178C2101|nr:hypothetical protein [Bacillus luti]
MRSELFYMGYTPAKLSLMPYVALTYLLISSDLINIYATGTICVIFIQSFGSIKSIY